jgi:hypothetical protein
MSCLLRKRGSAGTVDIELDIAHRKAEMARYYVARALQLHQRAAR